MNNWTKIDFNHQLDINQKQLDNNYPEHWHSLLRILHKQINIFCGQKIKFLDVGCGSGAMSKLLNKHFSAVQYHGIDISEHAIKLAKENFGEYGIFAVKDLNTLVQSDFDSFDIVYQSATVEVIENGPELFEKLLALSPKFLLSQRMRLTKFQGPSYCTIEDAYGISTHTWYHNYNDLMSVIKKYGRKVLYSEFLEETGLTLLIAND